MLERLSHAVMVDAAVEVSQSLRENGVRHFFVKGVSLFGRVYRYGDRAVGNIDLFIHPNEQGAGLSALQQLGYIAYPDRDQPAPPAMSPGLGMYRPSRRTEIEEIDLDVRWGIEPVSRLLSRSNVMLPASVWLRLEHNGSLPLPDDGHHAALLIHHLVRHDLLHVRGLIDLVLLWRTMSPESAKAFEELAKELEVLRACRIIVDLLTREFGVPAPGVIGPPPADWRSRSLSPQMTLESWLVLAGGSSEQEVAMITPRRFRSRFLLADRVSTGARLALDAILPPAGYLEWRWPEARSYVGAWRRHIGRVMAKLRPPAHSPVSPRPDGSQAKAGEPQETRQP